MLTDNDNTTDQSIDEHSEHSFQGNERLYTLRQLKRLHRRMLVEHYASSFRFLGVFYPLIVGTQLSFLSLFLWYIETDLPHDLFDPFSWFGLCLMVSIAWPFILLPVNRGPRPSVQEAELILIVRTIRKLGHLSEEEAGARLAAHKRLIQDQILRQRQQSLPKRVIGRIYNRL
ncbi:MULTISPECIES: hypothetical protein [Aeromonas]|uniref:Uncharacterized protein n=1 Tax=Aeromonas media TaxID=651 RepID=A0AAE6SNC3_AERME|nr:MULTISPECIES: hypothetical protein [Aeromonas]QHQ53652.1 hypothetical protein GWI30_22700 [Aeromonas media]QQQ16085.1 hypothetical protein JJL53_23755 [Aeromonas media]